MAQFGFIHIVTLYDTLLLIIIVLMKKILASLLVGSFGFSSFSVFAETGATLTPTSGKADHFEVSIKSPVRV